MGEESFESVHARQQRRVRLGLLVVLTLLAGVVVGLAIVVTLPLRSLGIEAGPAVPSVPAITPEAADRPG